MAGRYMYFPGLSLALVVALVVTAVYARNAGSRSAVLALGIGVGLSLTVNVLLTVRDIANWKDDVSLWTRVIELSPDTGRAYFQRSRAYRSKGEYAHALADLERAISIAAGKGYHAMYELYRSRAAIHTEMGDFTSVVADYSKALESATGEVRQMTFYQRGVAYQRLGKDNLANDDFKVSGIVGAGLEK
jgi:tetratricopeptide (TPR) repeat protein